ncbi:MAG: Wzz/FepE/Etk N-terminal domain-containing protein [Acidobacteriota bacterium]
MAEDKKGSQEQAVQPVYVLPPGYYPDWVDEGPTLGDYFRVLWKRRHYIVGFTLLCAAAAFTVSLLLPKKYEAQAILLVQRPVFSSELRPRTLPVETYQAIVDSPWVKEQVRQRAVAEGLISSEDVLTDALEASVPERPRGQEELVNPIIELTVTWKDPRIAQRLADLWADVAIQASAGLALQGSQGTIEFVQKEYPTTRERLLQLEAELKTTQDRHDKRIRELEKRWDERITAFKVEWNLDVLRQQAQGLEKRLTENTMRLSDLQLEIKNTRETLTQLKEEIQQHPQFLVISKAITDDALWERIGRDFSGQTAQELEKLKLRSEQLNPVYEQLLQRLTDTQVRFDTLIPQEQYLKEEIARLEKELRQLNELILTKSLELRELERARDLELTLAKRERQFEVDQLQREVEKARATFSTLAEKWEAARLTQAEEDQDLKIGAYATEPQEPVSPRPLLNTAIALAVGLMLSVMGAFVGEFLNSESSIGSVPSTKFASSSMVPGDR